MRLQALAQAQAVPQAHAPLSSNLASDCHFKLLLDSIELVVRLKRTGILELAHELLTTGPQASSLPRRAESSSVIGSRELNGRQRLSEAPDRVDSISLPLPGAVASSRATRSSSGRRSNTPHTGTMGNANSSEQQQQQRVSQTGSAPSTSTGAERRRHAQSSNNSSAAPSPRLRTHTLPPTTSVAPTTTTTTAHAEPSSSSASAVAHSSSVAAAAAAAASAASSANTTIDDDSSTTRSGRTSEPGRRKKSIELSDVDPSLTFSSRAPSLARGVRRKTNDRIHGDIIIAPEDVDVDDPEPLGSGTLRGAMQGKAEHVVYGPRRSAPPESPMTLTPTTELASRPQAIDLPTPDITATLVDPDDTVHPGFAASPRLTAAVILSQDQMPVLVSPISEVAPTDSPLYGAGSTPSSQTSSGKSSIVPRSLSSVLSSVSAPSTIALAAAGRLPTSKLGATSALAPIPASQLQTPHTAPPMHTNIAPTDTVQAPPIPSNHLPISEADIPSGTSVIASPVVTPVPGGTPTGAIVSPAVLLPPRLLNAPVAAIPIPLLSVPSATIAASLLAAAVDLGAGTEGVPTLIKWKDEDGQVPASSDGKRPAQGPSEVYVTGTFAKGWQTKIELRKANAADFSALISLPPGPHRLKFIVDKEWKASKNLPVATDADGNLINYLHVNAADSKLATELWKASGTGSTAPTTRTQPSVSAPNSTSLWPTFGDEDDAEAPGVDGGVDGLDDSEWTSEIPYELVEYGEWEAERDAIENSSAFLNPPPNSPPIVLPPPPAVSGVPPPSLPAQLEKGPLNHAAYVTQGSGDDNSILPKPDHSVINHLAASPIKGGFLSVGVTTRYKRKFVTIVYYKALAART
ncbi:BZ3500_MvSof-1268-A1-R1_Chr7-1g09046 [Microbotryum saponariae]|uniref:BZ3500_MvSof-1268-A1-R1_Chr7-1g09046 protein n=1 Tax=Microbotryum saponariae TaxID=289078 RepID=A0A2X0MZ89_9BASI|nr:BZ3501_MvSof-1269-A2-R1_Chr7-1g08750 [Microbotryum saponariae]SDA02685.1 BZ3500_MvSof-1268-A1-R1_Chr7-1g09046 [Microbotryum saponariae]